MLKEKKKLTVKVESLNRKVQNLQAKLAAAKATSTATAPSEPLSHSPQAQAPPPPSALLTTQSQTPQAASIPFTRPRSATVTAVPPSRRSPSDTPQEVKRKSSASVRVVSGPSSLPRPKTPERSRAVMPVFKNQTPERRLTEARTPDRRMTESGPLPSAVVIGKKRAAPDDFEACENIPVQAFTADGEDVENKTPRVRRMLNSLQSGFTPVRSQNTRPTVPMPSPRRSVAHTRTSPHYISDLTNSPYQNVPPMPVPTSSTKPSNKRSWLGKIRGTSQSVERSSGMRSLFDRGESS
ncbi:hypothetical protein CPB84DRAFT_1937624 [Gymnopilus junonius]|uniref:Uncharacterized protein n=1 Tax=Gymnopilus junonius TaxID=109634 RepID=A0A9P5P0H7_GYMJU|nr:hypothetical protein CPB84DRAFT_1937624 [Gymnopilus junonius]